ncbi:MAG TPA: alkyl sulfatase dimerization domain-containing protein [Candidatus Binataceae bacterium]|nr:alkyl sulfatase dimerization domain-containing protein [Candidatus Binataceae bacterium]
MGKIREDAEKLFVGETNVRQGHPFFPTGHSEEVAPGVMFFHWFANVTAIRTREGIVLIDTGGNFNQKETLRLIRTFSPDRIHTVIYTHGHVDHACGTPAILAEAGQNKVARPRVVGHRAVAARFDRYKRTIGYNSTANTRQFNRPVPFPAEYVYPDTYFDNQFNAVAGDNRFECHHGRGETDDHTWVYIPDRKVLLTGDFIIWAAPNAGNPQKAQRYAREWAEALRAMAQTGAEVLIPGHGYPVFGLVRVRQVLLDTANYLQSLYDQTIEMMNSGAALDQIVHTVKPPANLAEKPWLQAIYDEPEFIVRNIWRLEGGWYDGVPSNLKPATDSERAGEIAALAGGADRIVVRAMEKFAAGELTLACHLADWAVAAAPEDKAAHEARMKIYSERAKRAESTMAHGIFRSAALDSAFKAGLEPPEDRRMM